MLRNITRDLFLDHACGATGADRFERENLFPTCSAPPRSVSFGVVEGKAKNLILVLLSILFKFEGMYMCGKAIFVETLPENC